MVDREATGQQWCILRTSGARTLQLAESLAADGFEAWTPIERISRRRSRSRDVIEFDVPMMPSWVFVDSRRTRDLLRLSMSQNRQHPGFSVFRHLDRVPFIADRDLTNLRGLEARAAERAQRRAGKTNRKAFDIGSKVTVADTQSAWRGLSGIVEGGDERGAMVSFGGAYIVKIATWLLVPKGINGEQSAALAA